MFEIERPKIECKELNDYYGCFVVEPLERGFGTTLGNCLRRVLLSSMPGAAASSVKIDGVLHEFSTIPGVKEDVTEIILNIKELRVRLLGESSSVHVVIDAKGEGKVFAGDIIHDADVEIINPDLHIATLSEGANLYMDIVLEKGKGYVSAEKNKKPNMPIGVIAIDSIFSCRSGYRLRQAHASGLDRRKHPPRRGSRHFFKDHVRPPFTVHEPYRRCAEH